MRYGLLYSEAIAPASLALSQHALQVSLAGPPPTPQEGRFHFQAGQ
ncbi:MAG: hypothetical protein AAFS06_21600 [Cyanobacteria bacterium J06631_12]